LRILLGLFFLANAVRPSKQFRQVVVIGGSCFAELFGKFYREKYVIERIAILLENYP